MRKFIVQQWVTIDSIVAEEDGGLSFVTAQLQSNGNLKALLTKYRFRKPYNNL
jgi:hypothetical protein